MGLSKPGFPNSTTGQVGVLSDLEVDGTTVVVDETNNRLGVGLADPKTKLTVEGAVTLKEQANADGNTAAYGQLWVKTATPNELYFTTDADDDIQITSGTSVVGPASAVSMSNGSDNRVTTATGASALNGEANLTFDGTTLAVNTDVTATTNHTTVGSQIDYDATGIIASGQTGQNIALDIDINSDTPTMVGTVVNYGIDVDVVGGTSGTQTCVGLDVSATGGDLNYGGIFTGSSADIVVGASGTADACNISARTHTSGTTAGKNLTVQAGSAVTGGSNNINGGDLILKSGSGDGTGTSSMQFHTKVSGTDGVAERMRIHTDGSVGIGTNAPSALLHVKGATPTVYFEDTDTNYALSFKDGLTMGWGSVADTDSFMEFGPNAGTGYNHLDTAARDFHLFGTNTTTGFFMDEGSGLFGFGTTAPSTTVVVEGAVSLKERSAAENKFTDSTCDYNNDPTITMDSTANLRVGLAVSGTGIPAGATVASITNSTTFELSASTTGGAVTNGTLTFTPKAAYGQLWVKTATPNQLYFTTDAGDDIQLTSGTSAAGGGGSNDDLDLVLHMQVFS